MRIPKTAGLICVFALIAGCGTIPKFELSEGERLIAERPANYWNRWEVSVAN
jgi:hypothetical protein